MCFEGSNERRLVDVCEGVLVPRVQVNTHILWDVRQKGVRRMCIKCALRCGNSSLFLRCGVVAATHLGVKGIRTS